MLLYVWTFVFAASLILGQTAVSPPSSTSSVPAATHSINVGAAGFSFIPNTLMARVGDTVVFRFYPLNHSVARADFKSPCIPYEVTGVGRIGFWSGFKPTSVVLSDPPSFSVLINDTEPIFYYCSAAGACEDDGMVGVINPNATQTLKVQQEFAHNATIAFSPGENFPAETKSASPSSTSLPPTSTLISPSSTLIPLSSTPIPPSSASFTPASTSSHHALSEGAIAGIAIGGAAVLLLGAAFIYLCGRQRTLGELLRHNRDPPPSPSYATKPGHMSMTSSATYAKPPYMEVEPHPYSAQGEFYIGEDDYSLARGSSPDGGRDIQHLARSASPTTARSPMMSSPERLNATSPVPSGDSPMHASIPGGNRVQRSASQVGPHELGAET